MFERRISQMIANLRNIRIIRYHSIHSYINLGGNNAQIN